VNGGLGWDGKRFAFFTQNLYELITTKSFDGYYIQRLIPFLLTRLLIDLYHLIFNISNNISDIEVINANKLLNFILLIHGLYLWLRISVKLEWSNICKYFSISLLYINFFTLKEVFFNPVNTDVFALYIGIVLLYFYLFNYWNLLLLLTLLSLCIIPKIGLLIGGILLLFNRSNSTYHMKFPLTKALKITISIILVVTYLILCYKLLFNQTLISKYLLVSVLLSSIYLLAVMAFIMKQISNCIEIEINGIRNLFCLILGYTIISYTLGVYSSVEYLDSFGFLQNIIESANENPLGHISAGFYFGGMIIIYLTIVPFFAKEIKHNLAQNEILLLGIVLILGINSETRQMLIFFPFLVYVILKILYNKLNFRLLVYTILINLLLSRFWLPINLFGIVDANHHRTLISQLWFMNHGPWLSIEMHLLGMILYTITSLYIIFDISRYFAEHKQIVNN
jgi:hypothetical protein